jgi:hypothetical protein
MERQRLAHPLGVCGEWSVQEDDYCYGNPFRQVPFDFSFGRRGEDDGVAQEAKDWLDQTGWRVVDRKALTGPMSLIIADAVG